MNVVRAILQELWGLFVEDVSLTVGILACVGGAYLLLPALHLPAPWPGLALFGVIAVMFVENVFRGARSRRR